MAAEDVVAKKYASGILVGIIIIYLAKKYGKQYLINLYRLVYAWILNRFGNRYSKLMKKFKEELLSDIGNIVKTEPLEILEIGAGGGQNFKFFPRGSHVTCVDPNPFFDEYLKKNLDIFPHVKLNKFIVAPAEDMSQVPDESIDIVVCTLVLCSVDNQAKVFSEILRILKKGGKFYYLEHVAAARNTWIRKLQDFLSGIWWFISDGCTLNQEPWIILEKSGFSKNDHKQFYSPIKMKLLAPHFMGCSTK
ncbi:unnamed protein product [Owenia fusiformis]|uniref:Uncharacterized protein n=1 Tax=Owenia fusiformis TaxID=6347 RepID=A0A8J1XSV7_OWEFU|nr:unnamed protein product [Owenia fusiformis]